MPGLLWSSGRWPGRVLRLRRGGAPSRRPPRPGVPRAPLPLARSPLRRVAGLQESPVGEARRRFAPMVGSLFGSFLGTHAPLSRRGRRPRHEMAPGPVDGETARSTARRGRWSGPYRPHRPSRRAMVARRAHPFRCTRGPHAARRPCLRGTRPARPAVSGHRAVLLDDTYVSGARAQSAAVALRRAGPRRRDRGAGPPAPARPLSRARGVPPRHSHPTGDRPPEASRRSGAAGAFRRRPSPSSAPRSVPPRSATDRPPGRRHGHVPKAGHAGGAEQPEPPRGADVLSRSDRGRGGGAQNRRRAGRR